MHLIFVYGTLKRGCSNHHYLAGQRFIDVAETVPGFRLYNLGGYPGLVRDHTAQIPIRGEIWEVNDTCLAELDVLEGVSEGLYRREAAILAPPFAAVPVQLYVYAQDVARFHDMGSDWTEA